MSQGGGGGGSGDGEGALAVQTVEDTVTTEPQQVVGARMVRMEAEKLDCYGCHLPLKPHIFTCDANHLLCSSCRGIHGVSCGHPVAHSTLADEFAAAAFVPCDIRGIVYHEAADRHRACQHAPCGCPERCGFSGSRQKLLKHISGDHSRTILVISYGQPGALSLPLSLPWHVLVGEADRSVFLVSVGDRGEEVEVSLVCIRPDAGVPSEFSCKIAFEHSDDNTRQTLESPVMKTSSLSNGTPAPGEVKRMKVRKEYLSGNSVRLTVRIDKLAQPPPFSPKSPPFSPTPPPFSPTRPSSPKSPTFSPKSPPFSPTCPFSPKPSSKRPFSPMSPFVASPPSPVEKTGYKRTRKGTRS